MEEVHIPPYIHLSRDIVKQLLLHLAHHPTRTDEPIALTTFRQEFNTWTGRERGQRLLEFAINQLVSHGHLRWHETGVSFCVSESDLDVACAVYRLAATRRQGYDLLPASVR